MFARGPPEERWQEVKGRRNPRDGEARRKEKDQETKESRVPFPSGRRRPLFGSGESATKDPLLFPSCRGEKSFRDALLKDPAASPSEKVIVVLDSTIALSNFFESVGGENSGLKTLRTLNILALEAGIRDMVFQ
ncbi:hypothetical protein L1987_12622 [Smallanthus sonchifolius]|uniref:Uncharacterized protein n=1 Tax=Smallanthus sonchifolius TaxID=185202 RepID=A0ACB9JEQ4_9ASTR|nr:hypothetical protein L1987_12622 [Smallanthus sonchifolius]